MFDCCVCFGLLFTSDDDLGRTFILPYRTIFSASPHACARSLRSRETVFHVVPFQRMYVRVLQNVLCRERTCISSFADASQVLIPMDGILHVQLKNKHSTSSKHPMDGILRALWRCCHPMDRKMKTTSSAFTDQPQLCHRDRKHCILQHHQALHLTTPSVFSSTDQPSTPHPPSAMLQRTCHWHSRRPYYRQQA